MIYYNLVRKPIQPRPLTLADMPERVPVPVSVKGYTSVEIRCRIGDTAWGVGRDGEPTCTCDFATRYPVVPLPGFTLPTPALPKTFADEGVEIGRVYRCKYLMSRDNELFRWFDGELVRGDHGTTFDPIPWGGCPDQYTLIEATEWVVEQGEM